MWHRGYKKTTTEMKLTVGSFDYLALIVEGFLFGEISVSTTVHESLSNDPFQESILVYLLCICSVMHPEKTLITQNKRLFSMLSVYYMCPLWLSLFLILEDLCLTW